jgi:hypothetical protein
MSTSVPPPEIPQSSGEPSPLASSPSPTPAGAPARRPPMKLLGSGLLVVVLVVLALVIFGSSSNNGVDPIAVAATQSTNTPGFKLLLSMRIGSAALPSAVTGQGSGSFSTHSRTGSMSLTIGVPGSSGATRSIRMTEILDGPTVYMQLPASLMGGLGTVGKKWVAIDLAKISGVPALSSLESNPASSNPSEMLQYLKAASGSVTNEGQQVVDGFSTTRYHANIEISKIPDAVPASEHAAAEQAMAQLQKLANIGQIPVTVWVDSQHLVRRMAMAITATASGQTVNESFTIDILQYGPQPAPTIPPAGEVANIG